MVKTSAKGRLLATHPYNSIFFKINIKNPSRKKISPPGSMHIISVAAKPPPQQQRQTPWPNALQLQRILPRRHRHVRPHGLWTPYRGAPCTPCRARPNACTHLPVVHHTVTRTVYDNTVGNPQRIRHMAVDMARVMHRHRRRHIPRSTASAQNSGYGQRQ